MGPLKKALTVTAFVGLHAALAFSEDCKGSCDAGHEQCERMTTAVVAGVPGTTIAAVAADEMVEGWRESSDLNATGFSIYCGKDGIAVKAEWKDAFPPAAFFDLVSQAGSIVTERPLSGIELGSSLPSAGACR